MTRHARIIFNPEAGGLRRNGPRMLERAVESLRAAGVSAETVSTRGPGTGGDIARELIERGGAETILVAGGDGTINEVMSGVVGSKAVFGILPAGTANVLAHELGISSWSRALAAFPRLQPVRIPVGCVHREGAEARVFLMMAGAGFDARLVHSVSRDLKRSLGKLAYWLAGFSQIGRTLEQLTVEANGQRYQASFCLASRVRNYGGDLEIAPTIRLTDDDIEVIAFQGRLTATYLAHLFSVVSGRMESDERIKVFRTKELCLSPAEGDPVHLQVDGEYLGNLPARVNLIPAALTLLVPPEYLKRADSIAA